MKVKSITSQTREYPRIPSQRGNGKRKEKGKGKRGKLLPLKRLGKRYISKEDISRDKMEIGGRGGGRDNRRSIAGDQKKLLFC